MAIEPFGASIGVIGLAGLVSTAIEGFKIFRGMNAFGRDQEVLCMKLDIEKTLLLHWAQKVGLLKHNLIDGRLVNPKTDLLIHRVLVQIIALLKDGERLRQKYGLSRVPASESDFRTDCVSKYRMRQLESQGNRHGPLDVHENNEKKVSRARKFVWTIHDKSEFNALIAELGYFIAKLTQMIPTLEHRKMMREDLERVGSDVHTLRLIEAATDGVHDDWSDIASQLAEETERATSTSGSRRSEKRGRRRERERSSHEPSRHRSRTPVYSQPQRSRHVLVEMVSDVVGRGQRPVSTFRHS